MRIPKPRDASACPTDVHEQRGDIQIALPEVTVQGCLVANDNNPVPVAESGFTVLDSEPGFWLYKQREEVVSSAGHTLGVCHSPNAQAWAICGGKVETGLG